MVVGFNRTTKPEPETKSRAKTQGCAYVMVQKLSEAQTQQHGRPTLDQEW